MSRSSQLEALLRPATLQHLLERIFGSRRAIIFMKDIVNAFDDFTRPKMDRVGMQSQVNGARLLTSSQNHPPDSNMRAAVHLSSHSEEEKHASPRKRVSGTPPPLARAASMPLEIRKTIVVRDADSNESLDHMPVTRQEYKQEIALRQQIEAELEAQDRILADYDTKLKDAEAALATVRKKWKQAATDLDKMKSSQQRGYHMTDSELKDSVSRLRYNISRFAIQYFGGRLPRDANVDRIVDSRDLNGWRQLSKFLGNRDITVSYIGSDRRRPYIVQALIWDTVYWDVFGEALWAGQKMSVAFKNLSQQLQQSEKTQGSDSYVEACRRFCLWRAETTAMVIETINSSRAKQEKSREFFLDGVDSVCNYICKHLVPLTKTTKGLREEVFDILQESAKLDEAMKRQAIRLEWIIPEPQRPFDSDTMTLASGETWDAEMDGVCLTTSPGLVRQGKSTGDDFGTETRLLSTEVSWSPSPVKVRRNRTV